MAGKEYLIIMFCRRCKLFQHDHGGAATGRSAHHHHSLPHVQGQQGEPGQEVLLETADHQDHWKKSVSR